MYNLSTWKFVDCLVYLELCIGAYSDRNSLLIIGFTFNEVNSVRASGSKVVCCHFSSDGKLLASGGHDKKVSLEVSKILP